MRAIWTATSTEYLLFLTLIVSHPPFLLGTSTMRQEAARVAFFDCAGAAWFAGDYGIFWTNDGGRSWEARNPPRVNGDPEAGPAWITDASGSSADRVWVVVSWRRVWLTEDRGRRWRDVTPVQYRTEQEGFYGLQQVMGASTNHAFLTDSMHLFRTVDRAKTWEVLSLESPWLINPLSGSLMHFLDARFGWYLEDDPPPRYWITRDGGTTWEKMRRGPLKAGSVQTFITALLLTSQKVGYVVLREYVGATTVQRVYRTSDGGETWSEIAGNLNQITSNIWISKDLYNLPNEGVLAIGGIRSRFPWMGGPVPVKLLLAVKPSKTEIQVLYRTRATKLLPFFVTDTRGWLIVVRQTDVRVLTTTDAGKSWRPLFSRKVEE
jgi:photosystem II stability/assembly factor-like uncharacterized protein